MQKYSVNQFLVSNILSWVQSGEIAIPEIQRPFVWDTTKVRDLIDSLYNGYPVGYVIAWKNPDVRLKDGSLSSGRKVIIDGQQRITALRAAVMGEPIVDKEYKERKIKIAFHPLDERFETLTPAIEKDSQWIADISLILKKDGGLFDAVRVYSSKNPNTDVSILEKNIDKLLQIKNRQIGFIDLEPDLDIETVTEIFVRINSKGVPLSQADFAMSKIASYEKDDNLGVNLRKCIDYFCHLAREPRFYKHISENDTEFASSPYLSNIEWLKNDNSDIYDPDYSDVVRVSFTKEFERGRLSDLVSLLSGRNFETRSYEQEIMDDSFKRLASSILDFMNETNFKRFLMIINSTGFISKRMITSQTTLNFAYIVYLKLKDMSYSSTDIEKYVRKWFIMSLLTGRYSSSAETAFDADIKDIVTKGIEKTLQDIEQSQLSNAFWESGLKQALDRSVINNPIIYVFFASQARDGVKAFLSSDITVGNLLSHRGDVHHIFPKQYLRPTHPSRSQYNQLANYALTQSEINIKIGKRSPKEYMSAVLHQCTTKEPVYGGIVNSEELRKNLEDHAIPDSIFEMEVDRYEEFLDERRKLMAKRIKKYYESLSERNSDVEINVSKILESGETNQVEFKPLFRAASDPNINGRQIVFEVAKTIAAFLNTEGGQLVIGVSDKGEAIGLDADYKLVKGNNRDGFLISFDDFVEKHFGKDFHHKVLPTISEVDGKDVCIVTVHKSESPVFVVREGKEEFYIRASASTRALAPSEVVDYVKTHWA